MAKSNSKYKQTVNKKESKTEQPEEVITSPVEPIVPDPDLPPTFLQKVLNELGVTPELNQIELLYYDADKGDNIMKPVPIFRENEKGFDIIAYTIDALPISFAKEGARWKNNEFKITRLEIPIPSKTGGTIKYLIPGKQKAYPFFPPALVKKFLAKEKGQTLFLTEGYKKAFKGSLHGLDVVGLISIHTLEDKSVGELHEDILRLIKECKYERVVFLHDGDCLNPLKSGATEIERDEQTNKENPIYAGGTDLYKRPNLFFQSIVKFRDLLLDHNVDLFFAHTLTEDIENHPKGLDDVLVQFKGNETEITDDLLSISKPGRYFYKLNITAGAYTKLVKHFLIDDVNKFYHHWSEMRPPLKDRKFVFHGTQYQWNDLKNECVKLIPSEAKQYVNVGTKFYKKITPPNQHGLQEDRLELWDIATINRQHGKEFWKHIPSYDAFCNVPSHDNFQPVIHNAYNVYYPLKHPDPEEDETFERIMNLIKHIFGTGKIEYKPKDGSDPITLNEWELGLDYIQILFQLPQEKLPVLCLVSKENETGKSTFCDLLRAIFQGNITSINNQDLKTDFNAHWITKLIVYCSETFLEKQEYSERIKTLSTDQKANVNTKGVSQYEIDIFLHFILLSNNESSFVRVTEDDTRYWVRKVPVLTDRDPNFLKEMIVEVPAFIAFLKNRTLKTKKESRMWFSHSLTKTDALKKVIQYNRSTVEKELRYRLTQMFLDFDKDIIMMSASDIKEHIFPHVKDLKYLSEVLRDSMGVDHYKDNEGKYRIRRYNIPTWEVVWDDDNKKKIKKQGIIPGNGRPFVFNRKEFVDAADEANYLRGIDYSDDDYETAINTKVDDDLPYDNKAAMDFINGND